MNGAKDHRKLIGRHFDDVQVVGMYMVISLGHLGREQSGFYSRAKGINPEGNLCGCSTRQIGAKCLAKSPRPLRIVDEQHAVPTCDLGCRRLPSCDLTLYLGAKCM
jgi:hypothetical protein